MLVSGHTHDRMHQALVLASHQGHPSIACEVCGELSGSIGPIDTSAVSKMLDDMAALGAEADIAADIRNAVQPHRRYLYPEIPKGWESMTFHSFQQDDDNAMAFEIGKQWAIEPGGVLVFLGPTGVGKSHLVAAIAQRLKANGADISVWEFDSWLDTLRNVFAAEGRDEVNAFTNRMLHAEILVLDEIRAERTSDAIRTMFEQIVNRRTSERKPMLISSNAAEEDWVNWSQRAYSRLRHHDYGTWVPMIGRDRRLAA